MRTRILADYGVNPRAFEEQSNGEPSVYFVRTERGSGWYTQGASRSEHPLPEPKNFWARLFERCARQNMAAAHSMEGVISAGAVGFFGADLLQLVGLLYSGYPDRVLDALGPAFTMMHVYLSQADGRWALRDRHRMEVSFNHCMSKEVQKAWVAGMGLLLKDRQLGELQATQVGMQAQSQLSDETKARVLWPRTRKGWGTAQDLWNYTPEQVEVLQVLCTIAVLHGSDAAEAAAFKHVEVEPRDAATSLLSMCTDPSIVPLMRYS